MMSWRVISQISLLKLSPDILMQKGVLCGCGWHSPRGGSVYGCRDLQFLHF